jgi:hypothetical protein
VVTITLPKNGKYGLNESVTATWSATDALSGVVSPVSGSVSIDTSSVGTKIFTMPAGTVMDKASNSSLKVAISYSVIENTEEPVMWSGLGMVLIAVNVEDAKYDGWVDTLLDNGFNELRECPDFSNEWWYPRSKAAVIRNVGKGVNYIWGASFGATITSSNWGTYRQAILDAAQWAQDNGVYEFQLGNEEEMFVDGTTMTVVQLITNLKALATDVKAIFTNGNVSYTCYHEEIDAWISAGKGDIDILASNVYKTWGAGIPIDWEGEIDDLVSAFGVDGTYLTEFGLNTEDIDQYSADEAVQATAITEMIDYIKASGMTRAFYFVWYHPSFDMGVVKDDGTYRLLWNQALLNSGSVKFATVPTKTTTILLPNTIALIQN